MQLASLQPGVVLAILATLASSTPLPLPLAYEDLKKASITLTLRSASASASQLQQTISLPIDRHVYSDPSIAYPSTAIVATPGIFCRAYADNGDSGGLVRLGGAFTDSREYEYKLAKNGDGVIPPIATWCCVNTPHGFGVCEEGDLGMRR